MYTQIVDNKMVKSLFGVQVSNKVVGSSTHSIRKQQDEIQFNIKELNWDKFKQMCR